MRQSKIVLLILVILLCVGLVIAVLSLSGGEAGSPNSPKIRINEIMTSNKDSVPDRQGNFHEWIEFYNPSVSDIDISGYGLSDDKKKAAKWVFPQGSIIPANGYIVVYCSGNTENGPLHTPFKLADTDALVLSDASGAVLDSLQLRAVAKACTLGRDESGVWVELQHPSPGFPNTDDGATEYRETLKSNVRDNGVRINELMASNSAALPGPNNDYPDWIELYNTTDEEVDLSGCGLSDSTDRPMRWVFPKGISIPAKSYLLVFCSKRNGLIDGMLHTSFALSSYEEDVVFSNSYGEVVDSISYAQLGADVAFARMPDGTGDFHSTTEATPSMPNAG